MSPSYESQTGFFVALIEGREEERDRGKEGERVRGTEGGRERELEKQGREGGREGRGKNKVEALS